MDDLKVLIVDDSKFMRTMIKNLLIQKQCEIQEAVNGQETIEKYREFSPDAQSAFQTEISPSLFLFLIISGIIFSLNVKKDFCLSKTL